VPVGYALLLVTVGPGRPGALYTRPLVQAFADASNRTQENGGYAMGYRRNGAYCRFLLLMFAVECAHAQKVKVEYNPKEDFASFNRYS
jgi:hypothetical protein